MHGPKTIFSQQLHAKKYRSPGESFRECCNRISAALKDDDEHHKKLRDMLLDMRFMPAGRIQSAIGSTKNVTPYNCYVSGTISDSFVDGENAIMDIVRQAVATMRMGGGIGYDFSTLRPFGDLIKKLQSYSSGPINIMDIFDASCASIKSAGHRQGAQMGVLRIDHPDIERFIQAKQPDDLTQLLWDIVYESDSKNKTLLVAALQKTLKLTNFNLSIAVTDEFMECLHSGKPFALRFGGKAYREVDAHDLYERIMRANWDWGEPGTLFIDTINRMNNLAYCETIAATNPCQPAYATVLTPDGIRTLGEVGIGDKIWSGKRWTRIVNKWATGIKPVYSYRTDAGEFVGTSNHRVLQNGEKIEVSKANSIDYGAGTAVIKEVIYREDTTVYDITVEDDDHTYWTGGCLVSNCGEQPLPPYGACLLGSFNLTKYVQKTMSGFDFNWEQFRADIPVAVSALDNVIDRAIYPLDEQRKEGRNKRRMGLGITGLANAGEALGHAYGCEAFQIFESHVLSVLRDEAYLASSKLAIKKGSFPMYVKNSYLKSPFISTLRGDVREHIERYGMRNSHLTSIAPTGTISLCADNISSSIEPVFAYEADRKITIDETERTEKVYDYGFEHFGVRGKASDEVSINEHLGVLLTAAQLVDSAVSKTCNVGPDVSWSDFKDVYFLAWQGGAKGVTTFRSEGKRTGILKATPEGAQCRIDPASGRRECD